MSDKKGPVKITGVETLAVCTCMQSQHWPMCDASHHTLGGDGPRLVELDKNKTYFLCGCFKTKNIPFCDGSHEKTKGSSK